MPFIFDRMKFIDSHTGGEPTRVIIEGGPDLGDGDLQERLDNLRNHHDDFRSSVINEPRGWDAMVGALLCEPHDKTCFVMRFTKQSTNHGIPPSWFIDNG